MSAPPEQRLRNTPAVPNKARRVFLDALSRGYSVTHAASQAGVHRNRFYELRQVDERFGQDWQDAYEAGTDVIRDEVRRRGVDGWDEPVFQRGELVGHIRKYSDTLLLAEAKRRDPSYRDNARLEVTGRDGGPVEVAAGYQPPTLADMVQLAGELGVLDQLGYAQVETIDGEAVEEPLPLGNGS